MGELMEKYGDMSRPAVSKQIELDTNTAMATLGLGQNTDTEGRQRVQTPQDSYMEPRGTKRTSDAYLETGDKENASVQVVSNQKKRLKPNSTRNAPNPSTVLSPKSANSRNLPQSPMRPTLGSPQRSHLSKLQSPLKPAVMPRQPSATACMSTSITGGSMRETVKARPGRSTVKKSVAASPMSKGAGATRSRKGATVSVNKNTRESARTVSATSTSSSASTGTTIVKPVGRNRADKNAGTKAAASKITAIVETPKPARRVLRKR